MIETGGYSVLYSEKSADSTKPYTVIGWMFVNRRMHRDACASASELMRIHISNNQVPIYWWTATSHDGWFLELLVQMSTANSDIYPFQRILDYCPVAVVWSGITFMLSKFLTVPSACKIVLLSSPLRSSVNDVLNYVQLAVLNSEYHVIPSHVLTFSFSSKKRLWTQMHQLLSKHNGYV